MIVLLYILSGMFWIHFEELRPKIYVEFLENKRLTFYAYIKKERYYKTIITLSDDCKSFEPEEFRDGFIETVNGTIKQLCDGKNIFQKWWITLQVFNKSFVTCGDTKYEL